MTTTIYLAPPDLTQSCMAAFEKRLIPIGDLGSFCGLLSDAIHQRSSGQHVGLLSSHCASHIYLLFEHLRPPFQLHTTIKPTMPPSPFTVIAGVGPGTGAAVARRFAQSYPVALLARSPENYESLVKEINGSGGRAIGISTDVSSEESVKSAFERIKQEYQGAGCAAAIFNASGPFSRKPLLEMSVGEFEKSWDVSWYVVFYFILFLGFVFLVGRLR